MVDVALSRGVELSRARADLDSELIHRGLDFVEARLNNVVELGADLHKRRVVKSRLALEIQSGDSVYNYISGLVKVELHVNSLSGTTVSNHRKHRHEIRVCRVRIW